MNAFLAEVDMTVVQAVHDFEGLWLDLKVIMLGVVVFGIAIIFIGKAKRS